MQDKKRETARSDEPKVIAGQRAQYRSPVVTHYGSAAQIVRTGEGVGTDGGHFSSDTLS